MISAPRQRVSFAAGNLLAGKLDLDRFVILSLAGAGGMGQVYRARDRELERDVAVKFLHSAEPHELARFDREAQILRTLDHPNIVRFIDHGTTTDGRPFLVLEWLEGEDLSRRLHREPLTRAESVRLAVLLARALAHAHARGVVHRDVKPANIFLVGGRIESVRLLDFGVARMDRASSMTHSGTAVGTPAYMSPEQASGSREVDGRADLFSLGCVLFECLTSRAPFLGAHLMAVLAKVLFEDPPRLSELALDVPEALDALVSRMLRKAPGDRPRDGEEIARALEGVELAAPGASAPSERPGPITRGEQRLLAVVMTAPPHHARTLTEDNATAAIVPAGEPEGDAAIVRSFRAEYSPLADGSSVAVLAADGSASDLAFRAARCALALRARHPALPIAIGIGRGVATGRVPVGEAIDRAAMLVRRHGASAGGEDHGAAIRIDDLGAGLLDERFAFGGDVHGLWLHAEREPHAAARLLLGRPTPCVGRARELASIEAMLAECVEEPVARGALVVGPAGMGKSRVRHEIVRRLRESRPDMDVWIGRADPLSAGAPFAVLGSALRRAFGLVDGEAAVVQHRKIRARTSRHVAEDESSRVAEFLGEILGVPFPDDESVQLRAARRDPTLMGDQTCRAFEDFVDAETRAAPLCLVLEDLQWGDGATMRLVESALRHARERPLFVLAVARPEVSSLVGVGALARALMPVSIGPLGKKAAGELVSEALGPALDDAVRTELVTRAGGSPLYLEELVRHVAERKTLADVPETILLMLHARLEALEPDPRRILRAASIFGSAFHGGGVMELLGESRSGEGLRDWLPILLSEELVERRAVSRFPGEDEYVFRQALLRDAAYATLTERDREAGHRLAGAWLERAGEHDTTVLAEHAERGGDQARAARLLARSARQALDGHDVTGALALIARARAGGRGTSDADRGELALLEAEARRWRGQFAEAEAAANEAITLLVSGSASWYRAVEEAIHAGGRRGAYELAIEWEERIEASPPAPGAEVARALALCAAGRSLFHAGGYEMADAIVTHLHAELDAAGDAMEPRLAAEIHRLVGAAARHHGDLAGDLAQYRLALNAYERAGDARNAANARVSVAFAHLEVGDAETARIELERALGDAERMALTVVATRARQNLGLALSREGRSEEARTLITRVIEESHAQRNVRFEGWTRIYLARILRTLGDSAAAAAEATEAATLLEVTPPARAGALAVLALASSDLGRHDDAELHARGALAVLESFGAIEEFESLVWLAGVRVARARGDDARATERLERAMRRLEERASKLSDAEARRGFLERVPENAELAALAAGR